MFFQLTLLACLLVGSLSADSGLKGSSSNTRTYFVANYPRSPFAASASQFQPAAHHPRQPFAVAPAAPAAPAGPVAYPAPQPDSLTRQLANTNFKCADMPYPIGLYADTQANCAVYHYCTQDYHYSFACGEGTAFNQKTLTCDYPQNFTCSETASFYASTANMGVETGAVAPSLPQTGFTCANVPHPFGLYADVKADCRVFHYCAAGQQSSFACPQGTRFNQENLICDYEQNVSNCQQSPDFFYKNDDIGVSEEEFRHRPPFCIRFPQLPICKYHTAPQ